MRFIFTILLVLASMLSFSQKMGIDTTVLIGKETWIYNTRSMEVNDYGDKYIMGFYKGQMTIGGITITTNTVPNYSQNLGLFMAKYNSNNDFLWFKKIGECDTLITYKHCLDSKGNIVFGITTRADFEMTIDTIQSKGLTDIVILKYDSSGTRIFKKGINTSIYENVFDIIADDLDNIYFSGVYGIDFNGNLQNSQINFGNTILQDTTKQDYLAKYDSVGNEIWVKTYGTQYGSPMAYLDYSEGKIYAVGVCGSKINNDFRGATLNFPQNYLRNCFIAQLDTAGNGIWARHFGSGSPDFLSVLNPFDIKASGNRVSFTATDFSNIQTVFYFQGGPTLSGPNQDDYVIATYDTLGNFKWNTISKGFGSEFMASLAYDSLNNLYGLGYHNFKMNFPTDTLLSKGGNDIHVVSYDSNGIYRFAFSAGGAGGDIGSDIEINKQGDIYIVGGTTSNPCYMGNDTLYPSIGQSTIFYARIDSIDSIPNVSTSLQDFKRQDWSIYPNPVFDIMNIQVATDKVNNLEQVAIYDMLGRQIKIQNLTQVRSDYIPINISALSEGVYIVTIKTKEATSSRKIIKR